MAQRAQVDLVDDLTGEEAQKTVRFVIDGTDYEIDLTTENAAEFRSTLSEHVGKGRKATTGRHAPAAVSPSPVSTPTTNPTKT